MISLHLVDQPKKLSAVLIIFLYFFIIEIKTAYNKIRKSAMKLLPYMEETLSQYKGCSVQEFRVALSEQIRRQIFYVNLAQNIETHIKSGAVSKVLKYLCFEKVS